MASFTIPFMGNLRTFQFDFVDESPKKVTFEYSAADDEVLRFGFEGSEYYLNANKAGFLALAKLFLKMSLSEYPTGFHTHLGEDFGDTNGLKCISIALIDDQV